MVAILDYGIGNIASIKNMLRKIGADVQVTSDLKTIDDADKIILPGVGHFDYCMQQLRKAPFFSLLQQKMASGGTPLLGVCVGCQMLMESSEEGREPGLGWLKGRVIKFDKSKMPADLKIPHMGWTDVQPATRHALYGGIAEPRFYFVHSYHVQCDDPGMVTATADYGYDFPASVQRGNIQGVQFHPEKSHSFGMKLYANFINLF